MTMRPPLFVSGNWQWTMDFSPLCSARSAAPRYLPLPLLLVPRPRYSLLVTCRFPAALSRRNARLSGAIQI